MDRLELDSRDLKLALFTIVDDPVRGTAKYEFRDFKRIEPDASIFRIPAGYAIKDSIPLNNNPESIPASPDFK
jgi:hypothetical protein